jgi:nitrile hydratase beta subunit
MDGPHDLGGKQGFGPVAVRETEEPFHADWEARMWGLDHSIRHPDGWNIDWWRHGRELIQPTDYLTRPYLDQWMQTYAALLVDSGIATVAEIASGRATSPGPKGETPLAARDVRAASTHAARFDRDDGQVPTFKVGDRVRARQDGISTHTRLPAYVRGRTGTIERVCGNHVLPDASAIGEERAEPLYTVMFDAGALWPEAKGRRERIHLDLWQSYLERP